MKKIIGAIVAASIVACGGSNDIKGSVDGKTFEAKEAIVTSIDESVVIAITNISDTCGLAKAKKEPKNASFLTIALSNSDAGGKLVAVTPGEYKIVDFGSNMPAGRVAFAGIGLSDDKCDEMIDDEKSTALSGTITLTAIELKDGGSAEGTFELFFGKAKEKVTGSFGASYCDFLDDDDDETELVCS